MRKKANKPTHCAPSRFARKKETLDATGTCLTPEEILIVAKGAGVDVSSHSHSHSPRVVDPVKVVKTLHQAVFDPVNLVKRLHQVLGTRPGREVEWGEKVRGVGNIIESAYRPEHPEDWLDDPKAWLSNVDIEEVMIQYEASVPDFRFVGVFPSDFSAPISSLSSKCVSQDMCDLHVKTELSKGKRQIAFVMNLDKHTGSGTHWTSCYIGLDPVARPERYGIFYYDSVGRLPTPEVREFSVRIAREANAIFGNPPFLLTHNVIRKQFMDTECGVYSMFFLVAMIHNDIPFNVLCRDVMKRDTSTHMMRTVFFRPPKHFFQ
jgi:hypothetical protein